MSELAYSLHLGNDKNKSKKGKSLSKNNKKLSNNSIQTKAHLSKVNNHNLRTYDTANADIKIIKGSKDLVQDVKDMYLKEFETARIEYNNTQTRSDRIIENYFENVCKNELRDLACELIIEIGDKEFWQDKTKDYQYKMLEVFEKQMEDLESILPQFKIANAIIHFDESSPHVHIVGIPVKEGYKNGMKKQVAKSLIFTKEKLSSLQDKMRELCINDFNRVYNEYFNLKEKEEGRNYDISSNNMKGYARFNKEKEKNKLRLKEANAKSDNINIKTNEMKNTIKELKLNRFSKDNYSISKDTINSLNNYFNEVKDTTKSIKKVNDLTVILKTYEQDILKHDNIVYKLESKINEKDKRINILEQAVDYRDKTITNLKQKISLLTQELKYLQNIWKKLKSFFRDKVFYKNDKMYNQVIDEIDNKNVLPKIEIDYIKYNKKDGNEKKNNYELK